MTTPIAQHILWQEAGSPAPYESDGTPIKERPNMGHCSKCNAPARYSIREAVSDNFSTVYNECRSAPFGGEGLCAACLWCYRSLPLRNTLWFCKPGVGYWVIATRPIPGQPQTRPDPLSALLSPPEPPFVAGWGRTGIDHGGESNAHRFVWPGWMPSDPCIKIQSKHTAIYARVSTSKTKYHLQVDDALDFMLDVPLWTQLREVCSALLLDLRAAGVGSQACDEALLTLRPPIGCPMPLLATWSARTAPIVAVRRAPWWPFFVELLPTPPLPPREPKPVKAPKAPKPIVTKPPQEPVIPPAPAKQVPAVPVQISLF